jgi:glc operon protein GlcG
MERWLIMYQSYNVSHKEAQTLIGAIQSKLEKEDKAAAVAVTDSHGELVAFLRMDGCHLPPLYVAINKAYKAARECKESGEVGIASRTAPFPMTNYGDLRYTGWAGGFPIVHEGQVIGAIGVSGLDDEQEAELGRMALALIK